MLELRNLSIGYKQKGNRNTVIAQSLSATLHNGSVAVLVGSNGIGKSTLLRTVAGFLKPLSGQVLLDGRTDVHLLSPSELSKSISVVLTERTDVEYLSVYDAVSFGRMPYTGMLGTLKDDDRQIVEASLSLTGVYDLKNRTVDTLSDGQRSRVMIAKALAQQTPVILLDEPSAFLDYPGKEELMLLLRNLAHNENKAILISSHDIDMVKRYADLFWVMSKTKAGITLSVDTDPSDFNPDLLRNS
ncbi:MAG: ABC transporter ATP-binding protein [Bacteroidaceae bacterium]|nr:ABC transporter ATP-binding protein [Bacteroidaceae bacterium]